jgi:F-type H+-transporting ATPase subunit b
MPNPMAVPLVLAAAQGGGGGILSVNATLVWGTLVVFALFAWVLGRFAWGPLLRMVDEREKTIREQVDAAENAAAEAKSLLDQHHELLRGAGREREEILARATREADHLRTELVGKARAEAELAVARAREQMQRETEQAVAELRAQVADIAVEAASRIVRSSLDEQTQRRLVDDYIRDLPAARGEGRA